MIKMRMLLGPALVLSLFYLFVNSAPVESNNNAIRAALAVENSPLRNYLRRFYDSPIYVPRLQTGEILAKRAAIPFSGGIYGKRSSDSALGDLLSDHVSVEIRAMPMNGGFFG